MALFLKKKTTRHQSEKYWRRHHHRWERSGMSQADYCRREGIPLSSFTNWRTKLASGMHEISDFVEVQPMSISAQPVSCIELIIPSIGTLRLSETISAESLHRILLAVKGMV